MYFYTLKLCLMFELKSTATHHMVMKKYIILLLLVGFGSLCAGAQTLTVWPGDANNNGVCNHVDLLFLGLNSANTGPARNQSSNLWVPQQATAWAQPSAPNMAYSDCNGDGVVDRTDAVAVQNNFGLFSGGLLTADTSTFGGPASPILLIDIVPDTVLVQGTTTLVANLSIGSAQNPIDSLYGIAFTMQFDPGIVDNISLNLNGGWLNNDSAAVIVSEVDTVLGTIKIGITRFDHVNRSGYGTIGSISIVMDDNIRVTGSWSLIFETDFVAAFTASGNAVFINPTNDTLTVLTSNEIAQDLNVLVGPNPANGTFNIYNNGHLLDHIRIFDVQGKVIFDQTQGIQPHTIISTEGFPSGCYFLELQAEGSVVRKKLILNKN